MQEREVYCIKQRGEEQKGKREQQTERTGGIRFGHSEMKQEVLVMEAVATATEREKARQAEIKKLQNETCFIGHPFGVGIVSFKYMMGSVTSYGFSAIFIYYLYAAAPQGLGLTQLEASQFITLDIALGLFSAQSAPTWRTASSATGEPIASVRLRRPCTIFPLQFRMSACSA